VGAAVTVKGVSKRFGSVEALADVSTNFEPGEIHAVIGENGAGKSTLMGVLGGFVRPDLGEVEIAGRRMPLGNPGASARAGIGMVHQHFMLVPEFKVAENLALGLSRESGFLMHPRNGAAGALALGERLGWTFEPDARAGSLGVGVQQRLEILKALAMEPAIMIFDEPTAVLRSEEVEELFRVLRGLAREGKTVILIAHKLAEVLSIADRVTVLRKGRKVATAEREELDAETLAYWMLGERAPSAYKASFEIGEPALAARKLSVRGDRRELKVDAVDLEVRHGEILGIGGVEGNGQFELAEALSGIRPICGGSLEGPSRRVYLPEDRHRDGLALDMSVEENLLIEGHRKSDLYSGFLLRVAEIRAWAERLRAKFEIAAPSVRTRVRHLSGGNQQKVVVARSLDAEPDVLIAINPTRGLDLRATQFVRREIQHAAEAGAAVVLVSSDSDELNQIATRTLYMSGGKLREEPV
jgi:simple sugar transport system ATP-binding protein